MARSFHERTQRPSHVREAMKNRANYARTLRLYLEPDTTVPNALVRLMDQASGVNSRWAVPPSQYGNWNPEDLYRNQMRAATLMGRSNAIGGIYNTKLGMLGLYQPSEDRLERKPYYATHETVHAMAGYPGAPLGRGDVSNRALHDIDLDWAADPDETMATWAADQFLQQQLGFPPSQSRLTRPGWEKDYPAVRKYVQENVGGRAVLEEDLRRGETASYDLPDLVASTPTKQSLTDLMQRYPVNFDSLLTAAKRDSARAEYESLHPIRARIRALFGL